MWRLVTGIAVHVCLSDVALGHSDSCARVFTCSSYVGSNSVSIIILKIIEPVGLNENNVTFSESFDCTKSDLIYLSEHFVIRLGTCYPQWSDILKGLV
jgi:hypothetical protein